MPAFGWSGYAERVNGRFAMVGFVAVLLIEAVSGETFLRWAGLVQEAGRYFHAFDVLCQSSRTEGIPMVILEAMAMKVPLVVTGVGGVPDVVSPTEARIVASEDAGALAAALDDALSNGAGSTSRAMAARDRLDRDFSSTAWLNGHDRVYDAARRHSAAHGAAHAP